MSAANLPKAVLSPPSQEEQIEDLSDIATEYQGVSMALKCSRYFEIVRTNAENSLKEIHQARLKSLRKELDYCKDTSWKYDSIDKYIGQSSK